MLHNSIDHAEEDKILRSLREQQVEARQVLEALQSALHTDGNQLLIDKTEREQIEKARSNLEKLAAGNNTKAIEKAIQTMEEAAKSFVSKRMDTTVRKAIAGRYIGDIEETGH